MESTFDTLNALISRSLKPAKPVLRIKNEGPTALHCI